MAEDATLVSIERVERTYPMPIGHGELAALDLGRRALVVNSAAIAEQYAQPHSRPTEAVGIDAGVVERGP